jgi:hypothetical protein
LVILATIYFLTEIGRKKKYTVANSFGTYMNVVINSGKNRNSCSKMGNTSTVFYQCLILASDLALVGLALIL